MLNERRARLRMDTDGAARLEVEGHGPAGGGEVPAEVTLLLDARGALVGVDLGGEGLARTVVMLGAHEDVKDTRTATVHLVRDMSGGPAEIRIAKASFEVSKRSE
jgi:hypothetical protein